MTTALKSAASGQPGPAAYSSRTVKGAARLRPASASNDSRTAPAQTSGRRAGAHRFDDSAPPRPAAAERCGEIGPRTQPRHDALRPYVRSPEGPHAQRFALLGEVPLGNRRAAPRPAPARPRSRGACRRREPAAADRARRVNGSPFGAGHVRGGTVGPVRAPAGAGGVASRAAAACVTGTLGAAERVRRGRGSSSRSTVARGHRADRGARDRERRRQRNPKQTATARRAPAAGRAATAGLPRPARVARARASARARSSGGTCRWIGGAGGRPPAPVRARDGSAYPMPFLPQPPNGGGQLPFPCAAAHRPRTS